MDKRAVIIPTDEEDAEINRGIALDPDNPELDDAWFARARPASEVIPDVVAASKAGKVTVRTRGKQKAPTKEAISLRLDADVLAALRASGPGWQVRVGDLVARAVADGTIGAVK